VDWGVILSPAPQANGDERRPDTLGNDGATGVKSQGTITATVALVQMSAQGCGAAVGDDASTIDPDCGSASISR
jgi:hypothetical protein